MAGAYRFVAWLWRRGRAVASVAAITYIGIALSLVSAPMLAHAIGADGRGMLAGAFAAIQVGGFVAFLALPRALAAQDQVDGGAARGGVVVTTVLGLFAAAVCFAFAPSITGGDPWMTSALRIAAVTLALGGLYQIGVERLLIAGETRMYNVTRALNVILPSVGYIVAFALGRLTLDTAFVITLTGQVLSTLAGAVASIPLLRRARRAETPWRMSFALWASVVSEGIAMRIDQVLLAALAAPATLGVYAVASTVASASGGLTQAINTVAYGRMTRGASQSIRRSSLIGAAASVTASAAVVLVIAFWGTRIFGPTFEGLLGPLVILCIAQALNDQWHLRVYRQSASQDSSRLTVPALCGLSAMIVVVWLVATFDAMTAEAMALAVLANSTTRLLVRSIMRSFRQPRPAERPETL